MTSYLLKKVPMEMESSHSMGGASTFIALSVHIHIIGLGKALSSVIFPVESFSPAYKR